MEGEGGYFRRNHLVPVPKIKDLDGDKCHSESGSRTDESRVISGRSQPVVEAMEIERGHLLPCQKDGFDLGDFLSLLWIPVAVYV